MNLTAIKCPHCESTVLEQKGDFWFCASCGNKCIVDQSEEILKSVQENIGNQMQEVADKLETDIENQMQQVVDKLASNEHEKQLADLKNQLYERTHSKYTKYIDSDAIIEICKEIEKIDRNNFIAKFFEIANGPSVAATVDFLNSIDVNENYMYIDWILDFMFRSMEKEYIVPLDLLIEHAYKDRDMMDDYEKFITLLEAEAEKIENGIYETDLPRDVFIAYSSRDEKCVRELTNELEKNGFSCFIAFRNLRHGRGAVANYTESLHKAIKNSKIIVFVSSKNSRSFSCDAFKEELIYIKEKIDLAAHREYINDYAKMPQKLRKPRIEYRLDNTKSVADKFMNEFFADLDYCESVDKVVDRVAEYMLQSNVIDNDYEEPHAQPYSAESSTEASDVKYCTKCGAECNKNAKFCASCRNNKFSDSNEKFCVSCKERIPIGAAFCENCGAEEFAFSEAELEQKIAYKATHSQSDTGSQSGQASSAHTATSSNAHTSQKSIFDRLSDKLLEVKDQIVGEFMPSSKQNTNKAQNASTASTTQTNTAKANPTQTKQNNTNATSNNTVAAALPGKNKNVAGILGFLFGHCGFHWFYLGKPVRGGVHLSITILFAILLWPLLVPFVMLCMGEGLYLLCCKEENFVKYVSAGPQQLVSIIQSKIPFLNKNEIVSDGTPESEAAAKEAKAFNDKRTYAGILGFFLGMFGVHWFVLGRHIRGIVYIVISFVSAIAFAPLFVIFWLASIGESLFILLGNRESVKKYVTIGQNKK